MTSVVSYHLLRQTRTIGVEQALDAIQPLLIALRVGQTKMRDALRSLDTKGCIKIENRSGQATRPTSCAIYTEEPSFQQLNLSSLRGFGTADSFQRSPGRLIAPYLEIVDVSDSCGGSPSNARATCSKWNSSPGHVCPILQLDFDRLHTRGGALRQRRVTD